MAQSTKSEHVAPANNILDRAAAEGRELTTEERKSVQDHLERVREITANEAWAEGRVQDIPETSWSAGALRTARMRLSREGSRR